jgi:hypothetical protein
VVVATNTCQCGCGSQHVHVAAHDVINPRSSSGCLGRRVCVSRKTQHHSCIIAAFVVPVQVHAEQLTTTAAATEAAVVAASGVGMGLVAASVSPALMSGVTPAVQVGDGCNCWRGVLRGGATFVSPALRSWNAPAVQVGDEVQADQVHVGGRGGSLLQMQAVNMTLPGHCDPDKSTVAVWTLHRYPCSRMVTTYLWSF